MEKNKSGSKFYLTLSRFFIYGIIASNYELPITTLKKIYFASDFHLGIDLKYTSREREHQLVRWLEKIKGDAAAIYIVGDVFDFWFEYKTVVPKGFVRLLGKLAELTDSGIPIYFFTGNHDIWMFDYFEKELNMPTYRKPIQRTHFGKKFFIGHGDGLGPGDTGFKIMKKFFTSPLCQWLFERLHPNFGIGLANFWSGRSKKKNQRKGNEGFAGIEKEWLWAYAERKLKQIPDIDFFIFGHRHIPIDYTLSDGNARYINIGDWMTNNSYAVFDGTDLKIEFFENEDGKVFP